MTEYTIVEKDSFIVIGIGTELKSNYTDLASLNKEKSDFWQAIRKDGRLATLKAIATNDYIFAVNEAVNNKMMHYAGVMTESSPPEGARVIQFPKGEYLVVKGEESTAGELNNNLSALAFGQVLAEATNFAYVGGPNTLVEMGLSKELVYGEMWIPIIKK